MTARAGGSRRAAHGGTGAEGAIGADGTTGADGTHPAPRGRDRHAAASAGGGGQGPGQRRPGSVAQVSAATVERLCTARGLTPCGVATAVADPAVADRYQRWLAAGMHGSMEYLERHARFKADPGAVLAGCRSVLVVALGYYQGTAAASAAPPGHGRVAMYAWGRDYHKTLRARLRSLAAQLERLCPGEQFKIAADSTPVLETALAERAGVGFRGKHTLAINRQHGSWFFIGEILTTADIEPPGDEGAVAVAGAASAGADTVRGPRSLGAVSQGASAAAIGSNEEVATRRPRRKRCGSGCTFCIDVCPTRAIVAPYQLDARRCISYLTIEHRGPIAEELRPLIGDWLFGCDLCQEVCPWTVRAATTSEADFTVHKAGSTQQLAALLSIETHEQLTAHLAGSPLMRAGRDRLVRNACTVAGNQAASSLLPRLRELTADADRGVAEHARWAVARIEGAPA